MAAECVRQGITVHASTRVMAIGAHDTTTVSSAAEPPRPVLLLSSGGPLPFDMLVVATGPAAPHWLAGATDLATDPRGYVRATATLQAVGFPRVFVAGDCASFDAYGGAFPPKAGVYAVRQGPVLAHNLLAQLRRLARPAGPAPVLQVYVPQRAFLSLLLLGPGRALGTKYGVTLTGALMARLKTAIDRRWMRAFPRPHAAAAAVVMGWKEPLTDDDDDGAAARGSVRGPAHGADAIAAASPAAAAPLRLIVTV